MPQAPELSNLSGDLHQQDGVCPAVVEGLMLKFPIFLSTFGIFFFCVHIDFKIEVEGLFLTLETAV